MNAHNEQQALPCPFCGREPDLSFNSVSCGCAASPFIDREDALQVWNTRAAQPSPVVKQNLTTQPAAAQEAVATVESFTNGSYHRNYKLRWHKNVDAGTQLFAAPVAAAQGIDLEQFREAVLYWHNQCDQTHSLPKVARIRIEASRLLALIDASPKGALNEQFGSAEGLDSPAGMEGHYRHALERIASQGPHYGPDGTRETWQHWSDIARDALADSPKGGSERGHFQDRLADIEGRPRTEREPEDDEEGCLHEFVAFRSDCIHCGKAYVPPQAGDAEVQP